MTSTRRRSIANESELTRPTIPPTSPYGVNCKKDCKTCPSIGTFNRLPYDMCAYSRTLRQSTSPLMYNMSRYKYENCKMCTYDGKLWAPFDLVDFESELLGLSRPNSKCNELEYDPRCPKSSLCTSTFDKSVPIVYAPDVCPVVCNNIKKMRTPGYILHQRDFCGKPMTTEETKKLAKNLTKRQVQPRIYGY